MLNDLNGQCQHKSYPSTRLISITLHSLHGALVRNGFVVFKLWVMLHFQHYCKTKTTEHRGRMLDGSLLPCLWTKTNPDSTWNVMFLISCSENILFSLVAKRRDRKEGKEKGGWGKKQNWTKRNPEKCISGSAEAWVEPVRGKQAGRQSVGITSAQAWLNSRVIYFLFSAMQNPHTH